MQQVFEWNRPLSGGGAATRRKAMNYYRDFEVPPAARAAAMRRRQPRRQAQFPGSTPPVLPAPAGPTTQTMTQVSRWFIPGGTPVGPGQTRMQPVRAGNEVKHYINGEEALRDMARAMRTATKRGHYIYLLAWDLDLDVQLICGDADSTVRKLFSQAAGNQVDVRVMLSGPPLAEGNDKVRDEIRRLGVRCIAILDDRMVSRVNPQATAIPLATVVGGWAGRWAASKYIPKSVGTHHQKVLIVKGNQGLVAFCGGIDIVRNRRPACPQDPGSQRPSSGGSGSGSGGVNKQPPHHDVHCSVRGPAAHDLLKVFVERWNDSPSIYAYPLAAQLYDLHEPFPKFGSVYAQIARTYGNGRRHYGVPGGYKFAPNGEQTIQAMVVHAIGQARRFIYLEDQYLVGNPAVLNALQRAMLRIQHLTIVIPHSILIDTAECPALQHQLRRVFITELKKVGGNKVRVFHLAPLGGPNTYVHAKMWVFDDEFAIIGSANLNRRGYTHDSEVVVGMYDPSVRSLVKELRIGLWAKHLKLAPAMLGDGVKAAMHWPAPGGPGVGAVMPYNEHSSIKIDPIDQAKAFYCKSFTLFDPDGT
jgi:phosphatidylserine/phosphatidylglycerophosphate/cardiolipin synthase-like enzyme